MAQTTTQQGTVRGRMGQGPIPRVCGVLSQSYPWRRSSPLMAMLCLACRYDTTACTGTKVCLYTL